jgi:hypothetical protein
MNSIMFLARILIRRIKRYFSAGYQMTTFKLFNYRMFHKERFSSMKTKNFNHREHLPSLNVAKKKLSEKAQNDYLDGAEEA